MAGKPPTEFLLRFLEGLGEEMSGYAEALNAAGFRNRMMIKQLTKGDLVRCNVKKEHIKLIQREVKRLRVESKAAAAATAARMAALKPPGEGEVDMDAEQHGPKFSFHLVRGWLTALAERTGEDLRKYDEAFFEFGIDMMSSVPLIEQSDLRDMAIPRHHAEIFLAAAEEERRRQRAEGDRWDPTFSFQCALNGEKRSSSPRLPALGARRWLALHRTGLRCCDGVHRFELSAATRDRDGLDCGGTQYDCAWR